MARMAGPQLDEFLSQARIATLITLYADGSPAAVPVWFEWDGRRARLFTSRRSEKVGRIRADPRVCLSVAEPVGVNESWVSIEGTAQVIDEGGMDLARRLAPRYYTPEKSKQALAEWEKTAGNWVVVEITPRRIRSLAAG
jgi:PPOX class probable F420-dependent enzyme